MGDLRINVELKEERDDALLRDIERLGKNGRAHRLRQLAYLGLAIESAGRGLVAMSGAAIAPAALPLVGHMEGAGGSKDGGGGGDEAAGAEFTSVVENAANDAWGKVGAV